MKHQNCQNITYNKYVYFIGSFSFIISGKGPKLTTIIGIYISHIIIIMIMNLFSGFVTVIGKRGILYKNHF